MSTELFSKSALEKLSSPEQLDQMMKVTRPRSWIALSAMGLILIVAIIWSVLGSLPTSVSGSGIIMRKGGISNIVAMGSGAIFDLQNFKIGDQINKGQVIGHLTQPLLKQQIKAAIANQSEERVVSEAGKNVQLKIIQAKEEQLRFLKTTEQHQAELLRDGLITRQRYEETSQAIYATQNDIATAKVAIQKLASRLSGATGDRLNDLQLQNQLASDITSNYYGTVVEIMARNGEAVKEGQPILSIEFENENREVLIYLPPGTIRKLVKPGMTAQISPATSKKERYGYLMGKVLTVSKFPATEPGMMAVLNNTTLVRELAKDGDPIAVLVELVPDVHTRSGYAWSSKAGAEVEVRSGTLCTGSFVVENKRPISLVIPMLKETIGL